MAKNFRLDVQKAMAQNRTTMRSGSNITFASASFITAESGSVTNFYNPILLPELAIDFEPNTTKPPTPNTGTGSLYVKSKSEGSNTIYFQDDAGNEFDLTTAASAGGELTGSNLLIDGSPSGSVRFVNDGVIYIKDNDATALQIKEGSNNYLGFVTTNSGEKVIIAKDVQFLSTDAGAGGAPNLDFFRNSSSPAADDIMGKIAFTGKDDGGNIHEYAAMQSEINDASGGGEDGVLIFNILKNASTKSALELKNNEAVFNNGGQDIDFRIETDDNAHMLFIDGGDDTVTIGAADALHKQGFATINDFQATTFESQLADGEYGSADILRYSPGANDTLTAGQIYFLHTDGTWDATDADAVATGASQMLGVGLGGASQTVGVLTKGFIKIPSTEILNLPGSGACDGLPVYVSTTAGHFDFTAPSATNDFVRIVGYAIDDDSSDVLVYFDPDKTHVVIA